MSTPLTISIPGKLAAEFKQRIKEEATAEGISISEWVVDACAEKLRRKNESANPL